MRARSTGPIMITAEPGMGRTSMLTYAASHTDGTDEVLRIRSHGASSPPAPLAALRPFLPDDFTGGWTKAAATLAERAGEHHLVLLVDDAHLVDHDSLLAIRELHRSAGATLLLTKPTGNTPKPDPTECLRYEPGIQTVTLPALNADDVSVLLKTELGDAVDETTCRAVHAATGGNPRLVQDLLELDGLAEQLLRGLPPSDPPATAQPGRQVRRRLLTALDTAWSELSLDHADSLCRLALAAGLRREIAVSWSHVLLLRGHSRQCLAFLDSLSWNPDDLDGCHLALSRAMVLSFGLGRRTEATDFLRDMAERDYGRRSRLLAYRSWISATTGGRPDPAESGADRETTVFGHAAQAAVTLTEPGSGGAVGHLRRAIIAAEYVQDDLPWISPYLRACLIDALLLTGRVREATTAATDFHAAQHRCGWDIAVGISALMRSNAPATGNPAGAVPTLRLAEPPLAPSGGDGNQATAETWRLNASD